MYTILCLTITGVLILNKFMLPLALRYFLIARVIKYMYVVGNLVFDWLRAE